MPFARYQSEALLFNMNFTEAVGGAVAYRGELVLIEGEIADAQGRRKAPRGVLKQAVALAEGGELAFLSGFAEKVDLVEPLLAKYGPDLAPGAKVIVFVVNIAKPLQFEAGGATVELIPLVEGMVWNELADLIGYEKDDFKGQSAGGKVVTLVKGLAGRKTKAEAVAGLADALARTVDVRREVRGAV